MSQLAKRWQAMQRSCDTLAAVLSSMNDPTLISFGGGAPAREAIPADIVRDIAADVLSSDKRGIEMLQYSSTLGIKDLREEIAGKLLAPKGLNADPANLLITAGAIEGVCLVAAMLLDPGDVVLVESPSFFQCVMTFEMFEAKCVPCKTDENGLDPDDVEEKIKKYHPKMIYTVPTFHNPTGITIPADRRKRLAELASQYDVVLLEDDPYRDIRFSGEDLKPIKAYDTTGNVILANSLSKIFSPGSRIGYLVADDRWLTKLCDAKTAINTHTSVLCQVLAAEFFKRGYYADHHKKICDIYHSRSDLMKEHIDKYFPAGTKRTDPQGGLFIWITVPEGINTTDLLDESMKRLKVAYVPGERCYVQPNTGTRCMRLNFASAKPEMIKSGIKALGELVAEKTALIAR